MVARKSFTGRVRKHKTPWHVRFGEYASRIIITVGGIGTIIAVITVCVFLVWVVVPLFKPAKLHQVEQYTPEWKQDHALLVKMDENRLMGWALFADGTLHVFRINSGSPIEKRSLFSERKPTAVSLPGPNGEIAFGFDDGSIQMGRISFGTEFLTDAKTPASLRHLQANETAAHEGGLVTRTAQGQLRLEKIRVDMEEPVKPNDEPSAVVLLDMSVRAKGPVLTALTADGKLHTNSVTSKPNLLTGETTKEFSGGEIALPQRSNKEPPKFLLVSGVGDDVFAVWADGQMIRVNTRDLEEPRIVEIVDVLQDSRLSVTAFQGLLGKGSLLVGDSSGRVRVWFRVPRPGGESRDGAAMVAAHTFPATGDAITSLATSTRTRLFAAGHADGRVQVFFVTSQKLLADMPTQAGAPVQNLAIAPREDGIVAITPKGAWDWDFNPGHPETTVRSLFLPVWYEGYEHPAHVWQSSSGSDEFEPKFGMWPLVFGTLKATFYCLLLGVPIALLAAIYTSEFLQPRAKAMVKPTIEMMASLPSVVLGFLAALVFAPFVEKMLPAVLTGLITIPGSFVFCAYLWQYLPDHIGLRLTRFRFAFLVVALAFGVAAAIVIGPIMERVFFAGDLKGWLAGQHGSGRTGWLFLLFPLCAIATSFLSGQFLAPWLRRITAGRSRIATATIDVSKFCIGILISACAAWLIGAVLTAAGVDPRGSLVGTYVQRNALVVGIVMGFAVIPIVYTLAEDALSAVPEHLRAASLGCGATPWQTARRIIIPTAMSGIFSAVMIGLGRAVGETMIVLMAAGNTPVLEMNIFNGFRTLSANIAVELPEAVRNSTHYRTLYLAALLLFAMTFALNTVAEMVRQRFRKRAYQL
jgi:phosphate transport system permease protein